VIRLDGVVEISVRLGVADAVADVVGSGRTLGLHNVVAFVEPLCDSEAVLVEREIADEETAAARDQLAARVQGVVFGQQYLMLDYDCPRAVLDRATEVTPGLESPTIAPLGDPGWWRCGAGAARGRQRDHGRAGQHRGQGDSGLRHQVLPLLSEELPARGAAASVATGGRREELA